MKRFLIVYSLIFSAFTAAPAGSFLVEGLSSNIPPKLTACSEVVLPPVLEQLNVSRWVTEIIFRHHPDKSEVKHLFEQHRYPKKRGIR